MNATKLLAGENVAAPMVQALRDAGVDILYIAELSPGISDDEVLQLAKDQARLLLTEDKDFGELVFRLKGGLPGVIPIRLPPGPWQSHWHRLKNVIDQHGERLNDSYTVIEEKRVRFRRMPIARGHGAGKV